MSDYRTLELEPDGEVLRVWLARPERRNAVNPRMLLELGDLFSDLQRRFDLRVVVLGGRGASFCAGADRKPDDMPLDEPAGDRERRWQADVGRRACRAIEECEVVTIARVHGHAVGGGSCFAASCDFRVTTASCRWWLPEVDLGVPLQWAGVPRLVQEVGMARARPYILLGAELDGDTAAEWGLAHESVADSELDAAVDRWVGAVLARPELAVHMVKTQLRGYARARALGDASEADSDLVAVARGSDDFQARFARF